MCDWRELHVRIPDEHHAPGQKAEHSQHQSEAQQAARLAGGPRWCAPPEQDDERDRQPQNRQADHAHARQQADGSSQRCDAPVAQRPTDRAHQQQHGQRVERGERDIFGVVERVPVERRGQRQKHRCQKAGQRTREMRRSGVGRHRCQKTSERDQQMLGVVVAERGVAADRSDQDVEERAVEILVALAEKRAILHAGRIPANCQAAVTPLSRLIPCHAIVEKGRDTQRQHEPEEQPAQKAPARVGPSVRIREIAGSRWRGNRGRRGVHSLQPGSLSLPVADRLSGRRNRYQPSAQNPRSAPTIGQLVGWYTLAASR